MARVMRTDDIRSTYLEYGAKRYDQPQRIVKPKPHRDVEDAALKANKNLRQQVRALTAKKDSKPKREKRFAARLLDSLERKTDSKPKSKSFAQRLMDLVP